MVIQPRRPARHRRGARATRYAVPTMTTAPAWRTIAPNDLPVGCVGFMGGARRGVGLALARPDGRVLVFAATAAAECSSARWRRWRARRRRKPRPLLFKKRRVPHLRGAGDSGGGGVDFVQMAKGAAIAHYAIGSSAS